MSPIFDGDYVFHLDWLTLDPWTPDVNGTLWVLEDQKGFFDGATPRLTSDSSALVEKVNRHGAMLGPNWMMERIITLSGKAFCQNQQTLGIALAQIGGICSDPNATYVLSCDTNIGTVYANVRLDAQTQISPYAVTPSFQWSIQLIAPDPRKYSVQTYTANVNLPQATTGDGMNFAEPQNMVTNPDFATNTTGWTAYASTTLAQATSPGTPPAGLGLSKCMSATSTAAATNGAYTAFQTLDLNSYYVTGSAYLYATTAKTVNVVVGWYNASNALISESIQAQSLTASTWTRASVTGAPPSGATQVRIEARESASASGSVFYASGFQLEYGPSATPYQKTATGVYFGSTSVSPNGLLFGANNSTGLATLINGGSAPAMPIYTLYGPLTTPVLTATNPVTGTTAQMQYNATLNAGDYVVIDPSAPSVMFDGSTSRRYLLNPANFGGFSVPAANLGTGAPGALSIGLSHSGPMNSGGYATAVYQYAYF